MSKAKAKTTTTARKQAKPAPRKGRIIIATANGFAPNVPLERCLSFHRGMRTTIKTLERLTSEGKVTRRDDAQFSAFCATERNALRAVSTADVADLKEAAERAIYLATYWEECGGASESDAAYPFLSGAAFGLRQFLPVKS